MSETHIPGQTTRTAQRAPQDFTQPVHHLDLDEDCASLLEEASSNPSHRAAKTLSKDSSISVAIVAIIGGNDTEVDLPVGQAISLASQVPIALARQWTASCSL